MNEDDVKRLVRENPEESTEVEFKEKLSFRTRKDRFEFAKDISAMANALGGRIHLIVGSHKQTGSFPNLLEASCDLFPIFV